MTIILYEIGPDRGNFMIGTIDSPIYSILKAGGKLSFEKLNLSKYSIL